MTTNLRVVMYVFFATIVGISLSGCGQTESTDDSPGTETGTPGTQATKTAQVSPRNVRVLDLQAQDLVESLLISGTLRPTRGADLSAEEPGIVSKVHQDKGAYVRAGQPILSIDRRILAAEMKSAAAEEKLRTFNEERTRALFDENSVSGQEMLLVHTQAEQAKAQAEIAQVRHERAAFPAPFAGIVSERYVEVGEYILPGTRVVRILDPFNLELHGSVTERQVQSIEAGASVRVELQGVSEPVDGVVSWIGFEADETSGKFAVEIEIPNPDLELRPGTLGRAEIQTMTHDEVLAIPRDAVVQTQSGPIVFVAAEGRAEERSVSLGAEQGLLVIARRGLDEGESLIVRGQRDLSDGSPIKIRENATRPDGSMPKDGTHSDSSRRSQAGDEQ